MEEQIWALEKAYFTKLYKADYEGVLALVHDQFLGWPGNIPGPIDKEKSARFMKQLITKPIECTIEIEREGIRILDKVALTQYIIRVNYSNNKKVAKIQTSRITHTWIKEGGKWKLLGGMSFDQ